MFTRAFRAKFKAQGDVLEIWIRQSPGLAESAPDLSQAGIRTCQVNPGGGAQHAEVSVNDKTHTVEIYVNWS
jgi:hypothetical protein